MENASKALLIAGAILICILLIAIGMYIYQSAQGTINAAASKMSNQDKQIYNSMIEKYVGENKRGSDVKAMIEQVISQNDQNVGDNTQTNVDAAKKEMRQLYKAISSGKSYSVSDDGGVQDGIIHTVFIKEM